MTKAVKKKRKSLVHVREFRGQAFDSSVNYGEGVPPPDELVDMIDAYQMHPWVYSAVYLIATHFSSVKYKIVMAKDREKEDLTHPFQKILNQPNPFMTGFDLRESSSISLEMCGNAYWGIERDARGVPIEAWPLPPSNVRVVSSKTSPMDKYIYSIDGKDIVYDYNDMIHFKFVNPKSLVYGQSSILAARQEITTDLFASLWNKNFFKNSGRPDAVLEVDEALDEGIRARTMSAWKRMHNGVPNAHRFALLESGVKYKQTQNAGKEMDFLGMRKWIMQEILSVFNVPPALAGVLEYANYANMDKQTEIFWDILVAKINKFSEHLTMRAAQITFRPGVLIVPEFESVKALQPNFKVMSETLLNLVNAGVPINDAIAKMKLPFNEIEGGDVPRPQQSTGSGQASNGAILPPAKAIVVKRIEIPKEQLRVLKREALWKSHDQDINKHEEKFAGIMRSFFRAQKRRVLANLQKNSGKLLAGKVEKANGTDIELLFEYGKEVKISENIVGKPIKKIFFEFADKKGKEVDADFDFNLDDPAAKHWLENRISKVSQDFNSFTGEELSDSTIEAIDEAVREGYSQDETVQQIADRIDEIYTFAIEGRSMRIARTETASASNSGALQGMRQAGADSKEWLATHDEKTRESHKELDGEVVPINEDFISPVSGEKLSFPGDQNADPSETVNCRCALIPVKSEEQ